MTKSAIARALAALRTNPGRKRTKPCSGPCTAKKPCAVCRRREYERGRKRG